VLERSSKASNALSTQSQQKHLRIILWFAGYNMGIGNRRAPGNTPGGRKSLRQFIGPVSAYISLDLRQSFNKLMPTETRTTTTTEKKVETPIRETKTETTTTRETEREVVQPKREDTIIIEDED
jgi:hypothetical protein